MNTDLLLNEEPSDENNRRNNHNDAKKVSEPTADLSAAKRKQIDKLADQVRSLYHVDAFNAPFALGDGLTALHKAMTDAYGKASNEQLATVLNVDLSVQRISSLRLTADYFPKVTRNPKFTFKQYEQARKKEQRDAGKEKRDKRTGVVIAALMDSGEFKLDKEKSANGNKPSHFLTIRVGVQDPDKPLPDVAVKADGKEIDKAEPWMVAAADATIAELRRKFSL
ncbi:MAG TPA: hypothetical protein VK324_00135 [Tepidisphaeraceae bacterium]|nr:hypothetical protein [Tepidisphaeraceae bacterium]